MNGVEFPKEKWDLALQMYLIGIPIPRISSRTGIAEKTIYNVSSQKKWLQTKEELTKVKEEEGIVGREEKEDGLLDSLEQVWIKSVLSGSAKVSDRGLIEALKYRRLKRGQSTENIAVKAELSFPEVYASYMKRKAMQKKEPDPYENVNLDLLLDG